MRGRDGKTYVDTASDWDNPTWVEVTKVIDETINPACALATGGSREDEEDDNDVVGRSFEWSAGYRYRKHNQGADAIHTLMLSKFNAGEPLFMLFLDDAVTVAGAKGWRAPILLDQFPQSRNVGDKVQVDLHGVAKIHYEADGAKRKFQSYISDGSGGGTSSTTTTTTTTTPEG